MKKVFDQTVRDIKREVNKKVLKVPGIEQKVLDATSNEPWGPHGSLLADIAQATRNYHEYQMIMTAIWKRINDTGKNWRHVYKALTVLEYLVAHGAERVIDEIREHAYQISTLSNFQYIDSSGRDQGNNVRKKSQSLVQLVNDKERIIEVRQKAAANRDKFRTTSTGGMYRPGSTYGDRYDDDRYGSRDDDKSGYGYGREREWGYRDDDRSSNGRDYEERHSRDGYRDDDYRGRSQTVDEYQYGSRSRSSDRGWDRNYDDDGQHSSRGSNAKAEDRSLEARLERKLSEQNVGKPPSYEEAVGEVRSPVHSERDGEASAVSAPRGSSSTNDNPSEVPAPRGSSPPVNDNSTHAPPAATSRSENQAIETFDEFDPRGPTEAAPATSDNHEVDLLGSLSESFSSNALALVPATSETTTAEANAHPGCNLAATFAMGLSASNNVNQPFEDPFGDSPFKAISSSETAPSHPQMYQSIEPPQSGGLNAETVSNLGFGDSFSGATYSTSGATTAQPFSINSQFSSQGLSTAQQEADILADILPPAPLPAMASHDVSVVAAQPTNQYMQQGFSAATNQPTQQAFSVPGDQIVPFSAPSDQPVQQPFSAPSNHPAMQPFSANTVQPAQQPFSVHTGQPAQQSFPSTTGQPAQQPFSAPTGQLAQQPFSSPTGELAQQPFSVQTGQPAHNTFPYPTDQAVQSFSAHGGQPAKSTGNIYSGYHSQTGSLTTGAVSVSPQSQNGQINSGMFFPPGSTAPTSSHMASQTPTGQLAQSGNYFPQRGGSITRTTSDMAAQSPTPTGQLAQGGNYFPQQGGSIARTTSDMSAQSSTNHASQFNGGNFVAQQGTETPFSLLGQSGANASNASQYAVSSSTGSNSIVPQPSKEKFETKSTVWADTLSRGLVNLNISGPKINPLADIGIDFDAINRKERRMEKPPTTVTSTVNMGKAMGAGSGIGRAGAGAGALIAPSNPMMGQGMNIGMGRGGYGGMNPSMGMGMGQGVQMQQPTGFPPGSNIPGNYNPMMGAGGYSQQPYGGYR